MKIFLAHSFKSEDQATARTYIEFLEAQGHEVLTGEKAESKPVVEKVRERIKDCDIFIALFTKERPIYKEGFLHRVAGSIKCFSFSLWVFHELSYAMGLGKKFIMIIEDSVLDAVPNFHGDTENIRFERSNPERSFKRLTQMFAAFSKKLSDDAPSKPQATADAESPVSEEQKKTDAISKGEREPFEKFFTASEEKNTSELIRVFNEEIKPITKDEDDLIFWDSITWRIAYNQGHPDAFSKLESLPERYTNKSQAFLFLGDAYKQLSAHDKADICYKQAFALADLSNDPGVDIYIESRKKVALELAKNKDYKGAIEILMSDFNNPKLDSKKNVIARALAYLAKEASDLNRFHYFAEYCLSLDPADSKLRFDLAFSYLENAQPKLSMLHNRILVKNSSDNSAALNNLGVAYDRLDLDFKAVKYFKKAAKEKETLAMANLAQDLIHAGFEEDARTLLKQAEALSVEGVHVSEQVGLAKNNLEDLLKKEEKNASKAFEEAEEQRRYYSSFAKNRLSTKSFNFAGKWRSQMGDISITVDKTKIATNLKEPLPYDIDGKIYNDILVQETKIEGEVEGAVALCKMDFKRVLNFSTGRTINEKEYKGELWLIGLEDGNTMQVMLTTSGKITYENWERVL